MIRFIRILNGAISRAGSLWELIREIVDEYLAPPDFSGGDYEVNDLTELIQGGSNGNKNGNEWPNADERVATIERDGEAHFSGNEEYTLVDGD